MNPGKTSCGGGCGELTAEVPLAFMDPTPSADRCLWAS